MCFEVCFVVCVQVIKEVKEKKVVFVVVKKFEKVKVVVNVFKGCIVGKQGVKGVQFKFVIYSC